MASWRLKVFHWLNLCWDAPYSPISCDGSSLGSESAGAQTSLI